MVVVLGMFASTARRFFVLAEILGVAGGLLSRRSGEDVPDVGDASVHGTCEDKKKKINVTSKMLQLNYFKFFKYS